MIELMAAYKRHAEAYYRKNGKVTNEVTAILSAIKFAGELYGREPVGDFGPLKLQSIQQAMIRAGWCRNNINKQVGRVVRMFSWGVSQEVVPASVALALREVPGLRKPVKRPPHHLLTTWWSERPCPICRQSWRIWRGYSG